MHRELPRIFSEQDCPQTRPTITRTPWKLVREFKDSSITEYGTIGSLVCVKRRYDRKTRGYTDRGEIKHRGKANGQC